MVSVRIALISSFVKLSPLTYIIFDSGVFFLISCEIAVSKCVFPSPEGPCMKRGLYAEPLFFATAVQAAYANSFDRPTINVSNV